MKNIPSHFLVVLQFVGIIMCAYPNSAITQTYYYLSVSFIGILFGIYTLMYNRLGNFNIYPEVKNNAVLITTGPYRLVRHPMYLSLTLIMLGITLNKFYYVTGIGFAFVIMAVFLKSIREENNLAKVFVEYQSYKTNTKRVIPWLW